MFRARRRAVPVRSISSCCDRRTPRVRGVGRPSPNRAPLRAPWWTSGRTSSAAKVQCLPAPIAGDCSGLRVRSGERESRVPPLVGLDRVGGGHGGPSVARAEARRVTSARPPVPGTAPRTRAQPKSRPRRGPPAMLTLALPAELPAIPDRSPPLRSTRFSPGPPFLRHKVSRPCDRQQPDHLRSARPRAVTAHRSARHSLP